MYDIKTQQRTGEGEGHTKSLALALWIQIIWKEENFYVKV